MKRKDLCPTKKQQSMGPKRGKTTEGTWQRVTEVLGSNLQWWTAPQTGHDAPQPDGLAPSVMWSFLFLNQINIAQPPLFLGSQLALWVWLPLFPLPLGHGRHNFVTEDEVEKRRRLGPSGGTLNTNELQNSPWLVPILRACNIPHSRGISLSQGAKTQWFPQAPLLIIIH